MRSFIHWPGVVGVCQGLGSSLWSFTSVRKQVQFCIGISKMIVLSRTDRHNCGTSGKLILLLSLRFIKLTWFESCLFYLYWPPVLDGRSTALRTVTMSSLRALSYQVFTWSLQPRFLCGGPLMVMSSSISPPEQEVHSHDNVLWCCWLKCLHWWLRQESYERFLAATAALEVQMSVCVCVCVSVTLATAVLHFWRTSEELLKDFQRTSKGLLAL